MKFILKTFLILLVSLLMISKTEAMNFAEAYEKSKQKPMIVLIYAEWATNFKTCTNIIDTLEKQYGEKFNFVKIDIAKPEAAAFNEKYHIYSNLPYILMFRDGGKVSRYLKRDCASDYSCVESKMKTFLH